ncbi:caspase-8-like isoform X2 [Brienomyrus brachyistius]|uniref:caspase-8-like isoform X2 n=1 Tax=Brienomyrus brachyistius TaxID=42636 RepID=UPI0020B41509|nr:caspase-8-like isoform X2 [Brienomyrus brachyistius]
MDEVVLQKIDQELGAEDIAALRFLCRDHVPLRKLESVKDGLDLFQILEEETMLGDNGLFLKELLDTIGRNDLAQELEKSCSQAPQRTNQTKVFKISPYRKMLHELSENVTEDDLKKVKFLLDMPRAQKQRCKTFLELLMQMEKLGLLAADNLKELMRVCSKCSKQFSKILEDYIAGQDVPLENEVYDMSHRPRGYCLIINNYDFEEARKNKVILNNRRGTERDEDSLSEIFNKLHFKVEVRRDQTQAAILELVKDTGLLNHREMDAFVCCVLSHGDLGAVYGTDGQLVSIRSITRPFTSSQCPSLAMKPKLFFIQACQGKKQQQAVSIQSDGMEDHCEADEGCILPDAIPDTIPDESDLLLSMATVGDCKSFRSISRGSIFIQELCRQLWKGCDRNEDILTILTRVNRAVSKGDYEHGKQMPEPRYTLTKKLILPFS